MKHTIEFLKEHGVIEQLQKMLDIVPITLEDDITKDPNMKEFQGFALRHIIGENFKDDNEFYEGYFNAIHKDIIEALDLKKEGTGNMLLSMIADLFKEIK